MVSFSLKSWKYLVQHKKQQVILDSVHQKLITYGDKLLVHLNGHIGVYFIGGTALIRL